ncbi:hypothetical protein K443DRAFT_6751 [Laccaria amethystina LaAM-08-1]|uniref:Uncharacterized protein n=1 Tax=Laccaria amethystina LaAM-08-1 TaxID=1095629 RepID=A0A0C9XVN6_9AGAR|nr:hypothetical protein K443DRAFT_6751 [Laccaria amethystina LaAM-08-1]
MPTNNNLPTNNSSPPTNMYHTRTSPTAHKREPSADEQCPAPTKDNHLPQTATSTHRHNNPTDKWQVHTANDDPPLPDDEHPWSTTTAQHYHSLPLHHSLSPPSLSIHPSSLHNSLPSP